MTVASWLLFCATETVLCFTPGPAVLLVISLSLSSGGRAGLRGALGILAANAGYFILSATSLGAVLVSSQRLFVAIKWVGAAYLIWMGARMLFSRAREDGGTGAPAVTSGRKRPFINGLVTQGANPKALVFFTALLPQFVDPAQSVVTQIAILGISSIVIELAVLGIYITICRKARSLTVTPGLSTALDRAGGLLLIGAGAGLAAIKRAT